LLVAGVARKKLWRWQNSVGSSKEVEVWVWMPLWVVGVAVHLVLMLLFVSTNVLLPPMVVVVSFVPTLVVVVVVHWTPIQVGFPLRPVAAAVVSGVVSGGSLIFLCPFPFLFLFSMGCSILWRAVLNFCPFVFDASLRPLRLAERQPLLLRPLILFFVAVPLFSLLLLLLCSRSLI
jgi:hypothetical protein